MANKIQLTFWNYNKFCDYKPQMLRDWVNCGMTSPMAPVFSMKNDSHEKLREMLDDASELGVNIILNICELYLDEYTRLGEDGYREQCQKVYDEFCSHPAVSGVYVGEEPGVSVEPMYFGGVKVLREISDEIEVYTNLGSVERTERMLLGDRYTLEEWCREFTSRTATNVIGFGVYSQLLPGGSGMFEYFDNLRQVVRAVNKTGADVWATLLSSAHCGYRIPTESDFRWQLTTAVACGCKAVAWFRLYDKLIAGDYYGSPIDEFGELTVHYQDLARAQKNFNAHFAEIFARLSYINTYGIGVSYGGYHYFVPGINDLVHSATGRQAIISFFRDEEGNDYAAIVNTLQDEAGEVTLSFTDNVERAEVLQFNGSSASTIFERGDRVGVAQGFSSWMAPGQLVLIRLTRKA